MNRTGRGHMERHARLRGGAVKRRRRRRAIWARDAGICQLCADPIETPEAMTIDQIDPGLGYRLDNTWAAHRECNALKGDRLLPRFAFAHLKPARKAS